MKRKILSLLLVLALCLSLLPTAALASEDAQAPALEQTQSEPAPEEQEAPAPEEQEEAPAPEAQEQEEIPEAENEVSLFSADEPHTHYLCGGKTCTEVGHTESAETTFTKWESTNSLPTTADNYYLTGNVTLSYTWTPADGTVLDLNGYSITLSDGSDAAVIAIRPAAAFTLVDCKGGNTSYGTITHGTKADGSKYSGIGVNVGTGTFQMYGGNITGNEATDYSYGSIHGAGVYLDSGYDVSNPPTFILYNGEITNNTTKIGDGGGVYASYGCAFTMYDGKISGNTALRSRLYGAGGGVLVVDASFTMYGGEITENTAYSSGGGVCASRDSTFYMYGGSITNNRSEETSYGGGGVSASGTFLMQNADISGNYCSGDGAGVYMSDGTFTMIDSTIRNNRCDTTSRELRCGGGIYVFRSSTFNMKNSTITGNEANEGGGVYLDNLPPDYVTTVSMDGGEISGNNIVTNGNIYRRAGGVYAFMTPTISGSVKIQNNWKDGTREGSTGPFQQGADGKPANLFLLETAAIGTDGLTDGADIGFHVETSRLPEIGESLTIATNAKSGDEAYFSADSAEMGAPYVLQFDAAKNEVVLYHPDVHVHYLCGGDTCTGIGGHTETDKTVFTKWESTDSLPTAAGSYYLTDDVELTESWVVSSNIVLDLCGHSITQTAASTLSNAAYIESTGSLTLTDCKGTGKLTHALGTYGGGVRANGPFTMYAGRITDNTNEGPGGGVVTYAPFTMYGGSITNNMTTTDNGNGGGVCVYSGGSLALYGGSITGNRSAANGGGVYVTGNGMTVSGKVTITGNRGSDSKINNVYLTDGRTIAIGAALDDSTRIGVTAKTPANGLTVVTNASATQDYSDIFTSDSSAYEIQRSGTAPTTLVLKKSGPTTIETEPAAKAGLVYNGSTQTGVTSGTGYTLSGETSAANAGSYKAIATPDSGYQWADGSTAAKEITWSIAKKTPSVDDFSMILPSGAAKDSSNHITIVYDGTEKEPKITLKSGLTGCDFTVHYYTDSYLQTSSDLPKNVGQYTFWVTVSETSANFTASTHNLFDADWGFTITKADMTGISAAGYSGTYDGQEHTITVSGAPEGTTIRYSDQDVPAIGSDNDRWGRASLGYTNAGTYTVYFRVYGDNYNTFGGRATVYIGHAEPEIPTGLTGIKGQKLSTVALPDGWRWRSGDTTMTQTGTHAFLASYSGDANYLSVVKNLFVNVTEKATDTTTMTVSQTGITFARGELPAYTLTGKPDGAGAETVRYTGTLRKDSSSYDSAKKPTQAGSYTVTVTCETASTIYTASAPFTIAPIDIGAEYKVDCYGCDYTGSEEYPFVALLGPREDPQMTEGTDYTISGTLSATDVGTYTISYNGLGNYTGTASGEWRITPAKLSISGVTVASKVYDGGTSAAVTGAAFTGLVNGETLTLGTDYEVTSAAFNSANVNEADKVTGTIVLKDTAKAKNYTLSSAAFEQAAAISKAPAPAAANDGTLTVTNKLQKNYTFELAALLPALSGGCRYGAAAYGTPTLSLPGIPHSAVTRLNGSTGALTLEIAELNNETAGAIGTITVPVATDNYETFILTVSIQAVNKTVPTGAPTLSKDTITYGDALSAISFTSTALKDGEQDVPGTFTWADDTVKPNAGTYQAAWKFVPADTAAYAEATGTVTITVEKAEPTGEPKYTPITVGGKKLSDAGLTAEGGTFSVPGTVQWELAADTEVKANTAYTWKFTPTDAANYKELTGSVTLYTVSSSGGGSSTPTYPVELPSKAASGSISSNVKTAPRGSTVTITVTPAEGYTLGSLTVTDSKGNELKLTDKGDGKYTFTMPDSKVTVKTSFTQSAEEPAFRDVSADDYFYEAVKWAQDKGITGGVGNGLFGPGYGCTRAEIVTFLWRAAGSPAASGTASFPDVPADAYYAKAVAWAVENGITTGTGDGTTFSPDAICTRAQGMTFLYRAAKAAAPTGAPAFSDVVADAWYAPAVKWATDNGVTKGVGGSRFGPDETCTRAQIVTFLWRLYAGK